MSPACAARKIVLAVFVCAKHYKRAPVDTKEQQG